MIEWNLSKPSKQEETPKSVPFASCKRHAQYIIMVMSLKHSEVEYCFDMAGMDVLYDLIYILRAFYVSIHGQFLYFTPLYTKGCRWQSCSRIANRSTLNMSVNEYISALRNPLSLEIYTWDVEGSWRSQINNQSWRNECLFGTTSFRPERRW